MTLAPITIRVSESESRTVELKEAIPCGFGRTELQLDRALLADPAYLWEWSAILAYMWARKILPTSKDSTQLILLRTNKDLLAHCLHKLHRGESEAANVAHVILGDFVDELLEPLMPDLKVSIK